MKKPVIFLSHSSPNKEFVRKLSKLLKQDGIDVWLDELEIKVGESIHQKVSEGLKKSDFFAIVLSEASVNSKWVQEELSSASSIEKYHKKGIFVLPILIEECDVPPLLLDRRYANFKDDEESAYQELVDSVYYHFQKVHPEVDVSELRSESVGDILYKNVAKKPATLSQIPPRLFEEFIADVLGKMGYTVELTPVTKDGGADIIAVQSSLPGLEPQKIVVQCKRYSRPVGAAEVRELLGTRTLGLYDRAMLVTSSKFTRAASEIGAKANIDLVDRETISKWAQTLLKKKP